MVGLSGLSLGLGAQDKRRSGPPPVLPSLYQGVVATKCTIPTNSSTTNRFGNSRSHHVARDIISALRIELPNWYWYRAGTIGGTQVETNGTGTVTYRASVEYPEGVFTQILWGGVADVVCAAGASVLSDMTAVAIPAGAAFWIRIHLAATSRMVFVDGIASPVTRVVDPGAGDAFEYGSTAQPDKTMGGTITATSVADAAPILRPTAIVGMTRKPSILLIGDSKCWGFGDTPSAGSDAGEIARGLGPLFGYINAASAGDFLSAYIAANAKRTALKQHVSHVVVQTAINALRQGGSGQNKTAATVLAEQQTILGLFSDKRRLTVTTAPQSASSDGWATVASQTVNANSAQIVAFSDAIRVGVAGSLGYFDVADHYESARNSGRWKAPGFTSDGLHSTVSGYQGIAASEVYAAAATMINRAGL